MPRFRAPRAPKEPKPKKIAYELIPRDHAAGRPLYVMLADLVSDYHSELTQARIALAWCTSWKADVDGRVTIGKCKKASDLDRELQAFDFIILLSKDFWSAATEHQRRALLDHELCHASVKENKKTGDVAVDERGREVYRTRKHDLEEFAQIVERYGTYKRDLENFAAALMRSKQQRLDLDGKGEPPPAPPAPKAPTPFRPH